MKSMYKNAILIFLLSSTGKNFAQDFIRIGSAFDFNKDKLVQTFTFDLNRTEKIDEKSGKYSWLGNKTHWYLLPEADVNIGEKISSSENNILAQVTIGTFCKGQPKKISEDKIQQVYKAFEANPTFVADKDFNEKLTYAKLKGLINLVQMTRPPSEESYVKKGFSISGGAFSNIGYRESKTYNQSTFYSTAGFLSECKFQWLKKIDEKNENEEPYTNWQIKISSNYYYIISDQKLLYDNNFAGSLKLSIDKSIFDKILYVSLGYKLGNDTPLYNDYHALELSLKVNFKAQK
jgi:hypothetical protein